MAKTRKPSRTALARYFPIAEAVAALFKPHVEVVIHDLARNQIAYIANAFSRRRVGDSSAGDRFDEAVLEQDVIGPYRKVNRDGHNLRSITATLRDDEARPVAMMCINFDVSALERIGEQVASLAFLPGSLEPHAPFFHDNWRQALERTVGEFEAKRGMATRLMGPEARRQLVSELEAAGLLSIRNAPSVVAQRMGISRASLYNYLKEIRGG
ncbi:transcriptional regulator [Rhodanobacter sp. Si-c]|uniref:Transcriptional regulator n=1 Tax=Rhodanobacter lycopersici TaxID=3162487 RepID=A0ABV3Q979_9GAMM